MNGVVPGSSSMAVTCPATALKSQEERPKSLLCANLDLRKCLTSVTVDMCLRWMDGFLVFGGFVKYLCFLQTAKLKGPVQELQLF